MLTFGSLFAGIGGFDLGLERAGMRCMWQVEIDDYCSRVLAKHWPDVARYGDIKHVGQHNLEAVDLICGGFPCQPVSLAGRREAQGDTRWLWPEFARVVLDLRPRWVIVENVSGLLGAGMGDVLSDLATGGYDAEWDSIPVSAFGAPHTRYRVYIVAHATGAGLEKCQGDGEVEVGRAAAGTERPGGRILRQEWLDSTAQWATEPGVCRVAHGVPSRVDRIRALGNAVVPQVAEWIGQRICDADMPRIPLCTCAVLGGAPLIRDSSRLGHRYGGGRTTGQEEE